MRRCYENDFIQLSVNLGHCFVNYILLHMNFHRVGMVGVGTRASAGPCCVDTFQYSFGCCADTFQYISGKLLGFV